jgi:hypothetical protein
MRPVTIAKIKASEFYRNGAVYMKREHMIPKPKVKDADLVMTDESSFPSSRPLNDDERLVHGVFVVQRREQSPSIDIKERKAEVAAVMARLKAREGARMGYG